jgi:predicted ArsR family transcriptional regulator
VDTSQLDLLKTLGDNTRYAIYLELARASVPKTTAEISETLSLHPNTVRPHLELGGRGELGRPQHRYSVAPDAPSLGLEPPAMPVLARMVLSMAKRLQATPGDAEAIGYDEGRSRAVGYRAAPSTLEALVADLDRLGFDPVVSDDPRVNPASDDDLAAVVSFANCPFADLAQQHPDLVCSLHRGLVIGFVADMGDTQIGEFRDITSRTPCRVTVSTR